MKEIKNRIDLCFNLMDVYEEKIKDLILRNGIKEEDANNIIKNFRFKNENDYDIKIYSETTENTVDIRIVKLENV